VLVEVFPVVFECLLCLPQQSHDMFCGSFHVFIVVGGRVEEGGVAAVSEGVLEAFVPLSAKLLF
jgi:hypothetical protein